MGVQWNIWRQVCNYVSFHLSNYLHKNDQKWPRKEVRNLKIQSPSGHQLPTKEKVCHCWYRDIMCNIWRLWCKYIFSSEVLPAMKISKKNTKYTRNDIRNLQLLVLAQGRHMQKGRKQQFIVHGCTVQHMSSFVHTYHPIQGIICTKTTVWGSCTLCWRQQMKNHHISGTVWSSEMIQSL